MQLCLLLDVLTNKICFHAGTASTHRHAYVHTYVCTYIVARVFVGVGPELNFIEIGRLYHIAP